MIGERQFARKNLPTHDLVFALFLARGSLVLKGIHEAAIPFARTPACFAPIDPIRPGLLPDSPCLLPCFRRRHVLQVLVDQARTNSRLQSSPHPHHPVDQAFLNRQDLAGPQEASSLDRLSLDPYLIQTTGVRRLATRLE